MKGIISRFGSLFLLFLALYQISLSTKCHLVVVQEHQQQTAAQSSPPHFPLYEESITNQKRRRRKRSREAKSTTSSSVWSSSPTRRAAITRIPLYDLVDTNVEVSCDNSNLVLVNDTRFYPPPDSSDSSGHISHDDDNSNNNNNNHGKRTTTTTTTRRQRRRIPRIIHVTSKSRCFTRQFAENLELWKRTFPNYTFVVHNDAAMDRFLFQQQQQLSSLTEFPHLSQIAAACLHTAAGKADLWRALILYEYGGIYTDIDNAPGKVLLNNATITRSIILGNDDNDGSENHLNDINEAFFVVENEGMLSQYFMAAAPRHALLYLLIQTTLHRVQGVPSVEQQYVPFVTGPGALKAAFVEFMQAQQLEQQTTKNDKDNDPSASNKKNTITTTTNTSKRSKYDLYQKVRAGRYTGLSNWTVTVVGSARTGSQEYVERNVIYQKRRVYQEMGMVHFSRIQSTTSQQKQQQPDSNNNNPNESCMQRLYRLEQLQQQEQQEPEARGQ
jgi:Glycosyltransferase sugar-binding region containing DXD motif